MKETESSERCKVIIVKEGSGEVLTVNLPYGQDTLLKVLRDSLKHYDITTDTANEIQLTEKYAEHDTPIRRRMPECVYSYGRSL